MTDEVLLVLGVAVLLLGPVAIHLLLPRQGELAETFDREDEPNS